MGKGSAYKRKDGRWEFRILMGKTSEGKRVFKSYYGKSRGEAEYKAMVAQGQAEEEDAVTEMTITSVIVPNG